MQCPAVSAVASAIAMLVCNASPTVAQAPPSDLLNPQIDIEYVTPKNPRFIPTYERLMARKPLETLQQFLAPLKLPPSKRLLVKFDECGSTYVAHKPAGPVILCYEFVAEVERLAPRAPVQLAQTRDRPVVNADAGLVGPIVQALIREVTIAVFDSFQIPVWGRVDDAADRVTTAILLRFSKYDLAWNTIVGTAWFLGSSALDPADLSDVRGVTAQRYYTMLCIALGGDPKGFGTFVASLRPETEAAAGDLPLERARGCRSEFLLLREAFEADIMPHIDAELLVRVQEVKWIVFND